MLRLSHVPEDLTELVESMELLEKVFKEESQMEEKFAPLEEQFSILDKFEVTYEHEVSSRRANLTIDWVAFKETLTNSDEASWTPDC